MSNKYRLYRFEETPYALKVKVHTLDISPLRIGSKP